MSKLFRYSFLTFEINKKIGVVTAIVLVAITSPETDKP